MTAIINHIRTNSQIVLVTDTNETIIVTSEMPNWARTVEAYNNFLTYGFSSDLLEAANLRNEFTRRLKALGFTTDADENLYVNDVRMNKYVTERFMDSVKNNDELIIKSLTAFLTSLSKNPSYRAVENLLRFLDHNQVAIADDGTFVAYKAVRNDFKDKHSGKFDNSLGKTVSVPRNQVDEDPDCTCSHGLHVAAWQYARNFMSGSQDRLVMVKVRPEDVVAVPRDYNNQKMRVCSYTVVCEVSPQQGDILNNCKYTSYNPNADKWENIPVDTMVDEEDTWEEWAGENAYQAGYNAAKDELRRFLED